MMEGGKKHRRWQTIGAVCFFCTLALSLTYFSLRGLNKEAERDEDKREGLDAKEREGQIFFNGKKLNLDSGFATTEVEFMDDDLIKADTREGDELMVAAFKLMNPSLRCGPNQMKLKVTGPGAAELQLAIGTSVQFADVPEECGFSLKQTVFGLILHVPYDGCHVKLENGTHVLALSWRENAINLTCESFPVHPKMYSTSEPPSLTSEAPLPLKSESLGRLKRHVRWPFAYVPCSPGSRFPLCLYTTPPPTTTTTTTEAPKLPHINPHLLQKVFDLYTIYHHYGQQRPQQNPYYTSRHPAWQIFSQRKPPAYQNPLQQLLDRLERPVPTKPQAINCVETTTPSFSSGCPRSHNDFEPFNQLTFAAKLPAMEDKPDEQQEIEERSFKSAPRTESNQDLFWASFPMIYQSSDQIDPRFGWDYLKQK